VKRILIVEQDIPRCLALSDFLSNLGFETGVADTGIRAMHMLVEAHPLPDFILLDVKCSSINNWEFREMLKKNKTYKDIPVILMGDGGVGEEVELNGDLNSLSDTSCLLALGKLLGQIAA
jgi:CheY-like chemotaxis protein